MNREQNTKAGGGGSSALFIGSSCYAFISTPGFVGLKGAAASLATGVGTSVGAFAGTIGGLVVGSGVGAGAGYVTYGAKESVQNYIEEKKRQKYRATGDGEIIKPRRMHPKPRHFDRQDFVKIGAVAGGVLGTLSGIVGGVYYGYTLTHDFMENSMATREAQQATIQENAQIDKSGMVRDVDGTNYEIGVTDRHGNTQSLYAYLDDRRKNSSGPPI